MRQNFKASGAERTWDNGAFDPCDIRGHGFHNYSRGNSTAICSSLWPNVPSVSLQLPFRPLRLATCLGRVTLHKRITEVHLRRPATYPAIWASKQDLLIRSNYHPLRYILPTIWTYEPLAGRTCCTAELRIRCIQIYQRTWRLAKWTRYVCLSPSLSLISLLWTSHRGSRA